MADLYNTIHSLCELNGITAYKLCKDIDIRPSIITDLKMGRKIGLSADTANKIATYFDISVDNLLNGNLSEKAVNLYERIESLCTAKDVNITEMCKACGASRGSLSDLKKGRKQNLSSDTLSKISSYFDVSVDYLLTGKNTPAASSEGVTEDEMKIALFGGAGEVTDEMWEEAKFAIELIKDRYKRKLESNAGAVQDSGTGKH